VTFSRLERALYSLGVSILIQIAKCYSVTRSFPAFCARFLKGKGGSRVDESR
jgi:hypothetical protein